MTKWSVTQWWLASLDQYGNATLADGPHSNRRGVERAFYILQRLNLTKGSYACARVVLTNVEPKSRGVNEDALAAQEKQGC